MPDAPAGATIPASDVTAKVPGADDPARQARFTAIRDALTAKGMSAGRVKFQAAGAGDSATRASSATASPDDRRARGGPHVRPRRRVHRRRKYAPGKKTEHTDFAAKAGFKGVQHARSDGIMGSGTNVQAHHYVTFLDALKVVTGMDEWAYGMAGPSPCRRRWATSRRAARAARRRPRRRRPALPDPPDPPGRLVLERRLTQGDEEYARRVTDDGRVWARSTVDARLDDAGAWSFGAGANTWHELAALPPDAFAALQDAIRRPGSSTPPPSTGRRAR